MNAAEMKAWEEGYRAAEAFWTQGIQALADEATWLDFQEFFDRESPWYDPHEGLARVARDLLNPTPEDKP